MRAEISFVGAFRTTQDSYPSMAIEAISKIGKHESVCVICVLLLYFGEDEPQQL